MLSCLTYALLVWGLPLSSNVLCIPCASSLDCVKLTGLPYSATADDVVNFFNELADDIKTSGIHMVLNTQVSVMVTNSHFKVICF